MGIYYIHKHTKEVNSYDGWVANHEAFMKRLPKEAADDEGILDTDDLIDRGDLEEIEVLFMNEALERFDEMLDDCYEQVDVIGYKYCVSDVLKNVDPILYDTALQEYIAQEEEEGIFVIKPADWECWTPADAPWKKVQS